MKYPLASPDITAEDIAAVTAVLKTGMLVQGPVVAALEQSFCSYTGAAHAVAVSNGTATMHLALKLLGIGPGDEVVVPALSYVATANVVELVGAKPVFVDVEERTFNMDVEQLETALTPATKALLPVHEFGLCCDIANIHKIAVAHQLPLIEDAACALGATQHGVFAGTTGLMGSFSLHPRKSITSGEGGVLQTPDEGIATKLRQLRNHGIEMVNGQMDFVEAGFNYRMTDYQAALANSQMQRIAQTLIKKRQLSEVYFNEIKNPAITLPFVPQGHDHTWQTFHVLLPEDLDRPAVIAKLRAKGIGANYGAQCIPATTYYARKYDQDAATLYPNAWRAYTCGLAIPLYEKLTPADLQYIAAAINQL